MVVFRECVITAFVTKSKKFCVHGIVEAQYAVYNIGEVWYGDIQHQSTKEQSKGGY